MIDQMIVRCEAVLDLKNATLGDGHYYSSLPLCIIDCVFSRGVRYKSTQNVIKRYCKHYNLTEFRDRTLEYPDRESQHTISQLIKNIESYGIENIAKYVFCNKQRTSTRSGILKAEAVYLWAKVFERYGIEVFQDVIKIDEEIEKEILSIKGQKNDISLSYFYMASGNDDSCTSSRHMLRFISEALQRDVKDVSEVQKIMHDAATILKKSYPNMTVRLLDHTIWKYMSE